MSAVFEAVSDNRLFGITFDPERVSIICACNLGDSTAGAQSLDPAFAARFSIKHKLNYDEHDVKSLVEYMKENQYNEYLRDWITSQDEKVLLDMISSVEQRCLERSVPSMRALADLNRLLNDEENIEIIQGTVLFNNDQIEDKFTRLYSEKHNHSKAYPLIQEICKDITPYIQNWCAIS